MYQLFDSAKKFFQSKQKMNGEDYKENEAMNLDFAADNDKLLFSHKNQKNNYFV